MKYQVIEINPTQLEEWDEETSASVAQLEGNIGFRALTSRFKLQAAVLAKELKKKQPDMRAVDRLQLGIEWSEWYDRQVQLEVYKRKIKGQVRMAFDYEQKEFERMQEALKVVGVEVKDSQSPAQ